MNNSLLSPFTSRLFLAVWIASLLANFGMQIHTMAAGWLMLRLDSSPQMVALVQVAASLPYVLFALLAGALSDIYDKRKIMLIAQGFSLCASAVLALLTYQGHIGPWSLLFFILLIGSGAAFYTPTWSASVNEMVPRKYLAEAVNLNVINFNLGRGLAPALGGVLITAFGIAWAFVLNTLSYLGIVAVLWRWKPEKKPVDNNRESVIWAMTLGIRYALRTDYIRVVLMRIILCSIGAAPFWSLMPIIAKQHLGGDATTFTIVLTCFGLGAVIGGTLVPKLRTLFGLQASSATSQLLLALCCVLVSMTNNLILCSLMIGIAGICWMIFISNMNASIQMSSPDWVVGRLLAVFQTTVLLSFAMGGLLCGWIASEFGLFATFMTSALLGLVSVLYALLKPIQALDSINNDSANLPGYPPELEPANPGKAPIVTSVIYHITNEDKDSFLEAMSQLKSVRLKLGALNWSLQQGVDDTGLWIERYTSKDWADYKRRPQRYTQHDNDIRLKAASFDQTGEPQYLNTVKRAT